VVWAIASPFGVNVNIVRRILWDIPTLLQVPLVRAHIAPIALAGVFHIEAQHISIETFLRDTTWRGAFAAETKFTPAPVMCGNL
jgi:hypothetical protein